MEEMLIGVTDRTTLVFIPDSASTDGSGKTGLVAANLTISFTRVETDNDVVVTDATGSINDLASLTAAHADWGWFEVSNTVAPGLYRLDIADAVFASGAWMAVVYVMVTTSAAAATPKAYRLVAVNALDAVRMGMTALPNAAADAAGGLPISDAGGLDLDAQIGTDIDAILQDTAEIGAAGAGLTNINLPNQTMDIIGNITGNLSGEVGSIGTGGIATTSFAAGAINAAAIAANAITAAEIADGAIDAATFAAGAINAAATAADFIAEINAEVVDALATDTYAEPGQGTPAATTTLAAKIGYLYKAWRNRTTQTASEYALYNDDATTKGQEAAVSDDGVTFDRGEVSTGA